MLALTMVFGVVMALLAMADQTPALPYVTVIGGLLIGMGWMFYARGDSDGS